MHLIFLPPAATIHVFAPTELLSSSVASHPRAVSQAPPGTACVPHGDALPGSASDCGGCPGRPAGRGERDGRGRDATVLAVVTQTPRVRSSEAPVCVAAGTPESGSSEATLHGGLAPEGLRQPFILLPFPRRPVPGNLPASPLRGGGVGGWGTSATRLQGPAGARRGRHGAPSSPQGGCAAAGRRPCASPCPVLPNNREAEFLSGLTSLPA